MKMKRPHIVPLCQQSIAVLKELKLLTGHGKYLFPSERTAKRPMSNNTVLSALRRMGYSKQEMSGHGFRSMASTNLNEMAFHPDHIERQLAHSENDKVRAAYNYAEYLPERKRMMQAWGDYLDQLRDGGKVIPIQVNKA
jgi:integrase